MKNTKIKISLAAFGLFSMFGTAISANAVVPLRLFQLARTANVKLDKGNSGGCFEKCQRRNDLPTTGGIVNNNLPVAPEDLPSASDEDKKPVAVAVPQDGRVITETNVEIVEDDACECAEVVIAPVGGFPIFAYAALPLPALLFAGIGGSDNPIEPQVVSPMRP